MLLWLNPFPVIEACPFNLGCVERETHFPYEMELRSCR